MTISSVTAGAVIDPAWGNAVADAINLGENVSSTTPTYSTLTIGNGTTTARYMQTGKLVFFTGSATLGSTSSVGTGPIGISVPVAANSTPYYFGQALFYDSSAGLRYDAQSQLGGGTGSVSLWKAFNGTAGTVSSTDPFTWATGDMIFWSIWYFAS